MTGKRHHPTPEERDERIEVPLDPEVFIEGVLAVDPEDDTEPPADQED